MVLVTIELCPIVDTTEPNVFIFGLDASVSKVSGLLRLLGMW